MSHNYQIRVKDHSGTTVALLTDWARLEYTRRVNAPATHTLSMSGNSSAAVLLAQASSTDYQLEVWRHSEVSFPPLPWTKDYEGFHRTSLDQTLENGRSLFTSFGRGYDDLLVRREILYPAGSAGSDKTGPGETVIKAFVNENAGALATIANGRTSNGVTLGLGMESNSAGGALWHGARSWRNLLDVCQEIAAAADVDFGIVGIGPALFEFRAKAYPWGADRSVTGLIPTTGVNPAGNVPVVFSLTLGNMGAPSYSVNRTDEVNAVTALGQGVEADRMTLERTNGSAIALSPWNRRETTRNANVETDAIGLASVADAGLTELQALETFSFEVIQTPSAVYGRDYFLGDIVTGRYKTVQKDLQITAVTIIVESGRETINLEVTTRGSN